MPSQNNLNNKKRDSFVNVYNIEEKVFGGGVCPAKHVQQKQNTFSYKMHLLKNKKNNSSDTTN